MRVLISATSAMPGTAGETYLSEMLGALSRANSDDRYVVLASERQRPLASRLPSSIEIRFMPLPRAAIPRGIAVQRLTRSAVRDINADVLFSLGNFYTPRPGCAQVCQIENANVFSHPSVRWSLRGRLRNRILRALVTRAFREADHIVVPSRDAAANFARKAKIRAPVTVVHHGWSRPPEETSARLPAGRFVLCVSSIYPHKNLPFLIAGFARLRREHGYDGQLVIIGHYGPAPYSDEVRTAIERESIASLVHVIPPVAPSQLTACYRAADLLVMPSLEETFGLPVLEAMGLGCPVAAADVALHPGASGYFNPFREICGEAAEYFDPFDVADLAATLARTLRPDVAARLRIAGPSQAAGFTWTHAAAALRRVFDLVTARRPADPGGTAA